MTGEQKITQELVENMRNLLCNDYDEQDWRAFLEKVHQHLSGGSPNRQPSGIRLP